MIAKPNQPKHLHWCIVLAALTCVSASPSIVEPKTIFAASSAPKHPLGVVGQSDARVKRYLSTNLESMDDNNEDRGINVASVIDQGLAARVTDSVETGLRETAVAPGVAAKDPIDSDQLFKKVMGDQIAFYRNGENLFKSDKYAEWSKSVDEAYKTVSNAVIKAEVAKASTLLAIYEKGVVLSMLAAGRKDPSTQKIAKILEIGLVRKWSSDHNVENIMDLLTFGKDKSEVLMGMSLKLWFDYLKLMKINPYELFVTHFTRRYSDKELAELLVVAEANDRTRTTATELAKYQLKHWKNSGIGVIRSFKLLELNEVHLDALLRSPILSTWIDYVKMLGWDPYQVLFLAMRKRVGDKKLDSILAAAKADGTNASILGDPAKYAREASIFGASKAGVSTGGGVAEGWKKW
ncbi:unnamed protein product [Peronospora destructor]|uniref:Uncharacterized protein n=1 Tax=Peronospora destructor TaxID=86335 RepID=A0AAV0TPL0_9STRA|nr:unnamed protein product [Peronospora destructor]